MAASGFCLKCRASVLIVDARRVTLANGREAVQGSCPTCRTKVSKIIGKANG